MAMAAADAPWCADSPEAAELAALASGGAPSELFQQQVGSSFSDVVETSRGFPAFRGGGLATAGLEVVDASMLRGAFAAPGCAPRPGGAEQQADVEADSYVEQLGVDSLLLDLPLMEETKPPRAVGHKPKRAEVAEPRKRQKEGGAEGEATPPSAAAAALRATQNKGGRGTQPKKVKRSGKPKQMHYCSKCSFSSDRKGNVSTSELSRTDRTYALRCFLGAAGQKALHPAAHEPQAVQVQAVRLLVLGQRGAQAPLEAAHRRVPGGVHLSGLLVPVA